MSVSVDPDHFFQTSESIAEVERRKKKSSNKLGTPIQVPSKITAVVHDPTDADAVFIAESTGQARKVRIKAREKNVICKGPTAPLTSLAVDVGFVGQSAVTTLFAGCWDKSVYSWQADNAQSEPLHRFYGGHTDFVKCVATVQLSEYHLLISGGAEGTIVVWDIANGSKLSVLKGGHSRGILYLAIDPEPPSSEDAIGPQATVFSAGSEREIRRWTIAPSHKSEEVHADTPIIHHETSVNQLLFDADSDLWTASVDGTVKNLVRSQKWAPDLTLDHGSNVRCVAVDEHGGHVITAGRNEDIKVWDRATGRLRHTYAGHYNEVTGLVILPGQLLVSVGLDGTVRSWSLRGSDLETVREEAGNSSGENESESAEPGLMTEDEERELEELMVDDN